MEMMIGLSKNELRKSRMDLMYERTEAKAYDEESRWLMEVVKIKKEAQRKNTETIQVQSDLQRIFHHK